MCVIVIMPKTETRPTLQTLRQCAEHNPHGGGLAWVKKGQVHFVKGISAGEIHHRLGFIKGPAIAHFRIASVGPVDRLLCHPFPIAEHPSNNLEWSCPSVLFANGTWDGWRNWQRLAGLHLKGPVSDTRVAASAVWQHGIEWLADSGCKFVSLDHAGTISTIGEFPAHTDGCRYSNFYWKPISPGRKGLLHREAMACFGD